MGMLSRLTMLCAGVLATAVAVVPAAAQTRPVTAAATAGGNTINLTFVNNTPDVILCVANGYLDTVEPNSNSVGPVGAAFSSFVEDNDPFVQPRSERTLSFPAVPDGRYRLYWECTNRWGGPTTPPTIGLWGTRPYRGSTDFDPPTAEPISVAVPAKSCFGSVCLPGSR
ncbi:hypothetical protein [Nocardia sp. NPDC019395]|uniref:hypothetical protein n=1 Tax=Nocardia sp. NPDC019395 TaxID=3154686 RepID=UPI0033F95931